MLVIVLVFDRVSASFHQHHHDFGIDADAGLAALRSPSEDSLAFESHTEDSHDGLQAGHPAIALRSQAVSKLSGVQSVSDALLSVAAFVVAFPTIEVDTPVPDWPDRGPPQFTSFKSLSPAGRAPPLHAWKAASRFSRARTSARSVRGIFISSQFPLRAPVQRQRGAGLTSRRNVVSQPSLALRAFALALTLSTTTSQAADTPTFSVLLQQSLARAPILLEQRTNVEAARPGAAQGRKWLNPKVDALSEDLNAPNNGGQSPRQITFFINQPPEPDDKRTSRTAVSDRDSDVAEARRREAEVLWAAKLVVAYGTIEAA